MTYLCLHLNDFCKNSSHFKWSLYSTETFIRKKCYTAYLHTWAKDDGYLTWYNTLDVRRYVWLFNRTFWITKLEYTKHEATDIRTSQKFQSWWHSENWGPRFTVSEFDEVIVEKRKEVERSDGSRAPSPWRRRVRHFVFYFNRQLILAVAIHLSFSPQKINFVNRFK